MQKLGLKLEKGAFLAPMADYTNVGFRLLCREYGASLSFTELISCKSIIFKNSKTKKLLATFNKEKPVFLQLFGNNPKDFYEAIKIVEKDFDFSGYDLNAGCSVPKAVKGKYGCYIMQYPDLVGEIISEMCKFKKPVSLKMRLGFKEENFLGVAEKAITAGAKMVTLHARLGKQLYTGKANWDKIKELKEKFGKKIIVVGNGDIFSLEDYKKMKKETNCDFVMVARGALGNAFLFKQIKDFENSLKISNRTKKDIYYEGKRYFELAKKFGLVPNDVRGYYIKVANGIPGAKEFRGKLANSKTIPEMEKNFLDFFEK
jgi:tRNA-dihydrouridine synthase B